MLSRMKKLLSIRTRCLLLAATLLTLCWPALALAAAPPQPALRKSAPVWLGYLVMFVLLLGVVLVSLLPSKRGHQD